MEVAVAVEVGVVGCYGCLFSSVLALNTDDSRKFCWCFNDCPLLILLLGNSFPFTNTGQAKGTQNRMYCERHPVNAAMR